jgi:hypothetical protein
MPWKECHVMDERIRFVGPRLEGEKMAPLCAEFGISRKTGYELFTAFAPGPTLFRHERLFAAAWRNHPKWVVSRSLKSVGPNARQAIFRRARPQLRLMANDRIGWFP